MSSLVLSISTHVLYVSFRRYHLSLNVFNLDSIYSVGEKKFYAPFTLDISASVNVETIKSIKGTFSKVEAMVTKKKVSLPNVLPPLLFLFSCKMNVFRIFHSTLSFCFLVENQDHHWEWDPARHIWRRKKGFNIFTQFGLLDKCGKGKSNEMGGRKKDINLKTFSHSRRRTE